MGFRVTDIDSAYTLEDIQRCLWRYADSNETCFDTKDIHQWMKGCAALDLSIGQIKAVSTMNITVEQGMFIWTAQADIDPNAAAAAEERNVEYYVGPLIGNQYARPGCVQRHTSQLAVIRAIIHGRFVDQRPIACREVNCNKA